LGAVRAPEGAEVTRRRLLFGALLTGLVLVALALVLKRSRERHQQRQEEAKQRALDDYEREPGPPEYLVAFSNAPRDGFRRYEEVAADPDEAKYRGKVFRVVGRASAYRLVPDAARAELEIKDRDTTATFHLHFITSAARLEALQREGGLLEAPVCDEANGDLVIVDGIFESRAMFTHCYIRWKGKGDDWPAALREAKKGLDLDKINRP
jgi:hypothetical protein